MLGLDNRKWTDPIIQKIISILFGRDSVQKKKLENALIGQIAPIMQENVNTMMSFAKDPSYLQKRKELAELLGEDLGICNTAVKVSTYQQK